MTHLIAIRRTAFPFLLAAIVLLLPACDSGSDDGFSRSDLVGNYAITQILFETDGSAVADADVRAALTSATIQFNDDGQFVISYQFTGESQRSLFGDFSVRGGDRVELDFDSSSESGRLRMLLPDVFALDILENGARLQTEQDRDNVSLSDFSEEQFGGIESDGTLFVTMER